MISRRSLSKDAPGTAFRSLLEKQSSGFHGPTLGFVLPLFNPRPHLTILLKKWPVSTRRLRLLG
jgi:hypothetical protein